MSDIILHHYWLSPYAEKIRRVLGFKGIAWRSVLIPIVAPKPDLTALTGGYRKTPVLQIGADIYCDTDCIAKTIERLCPEPTLFPDGWEGLSYMIAPWQQELFASAVRIAGASADIFPPGFIEDRATMFEGGFDLEKMLEQLPATRDHLRAKVDLLERHLGGRDFLLGSSASLADFSAFHPLFALRSIAETAPILEPFAAVRAWMDRIESFGHGDIAEIDAGEAIEIAKSTEPVAAASRDAGDPNGRGPGDLVEIVHESFGNDPVVGEIVASSAEEIAIRRTDERAGDVVVHFPRDHYLVLPAKA